VRLFVNGAYWGTYVHIETIDRRFLRRWFQSHRGMLYEGNYACDLVPENVPASETESSCLTRELHTDECRPAEPGDDPTTYELARDLVTRIQALSAGGFYPEVNDFFEFDTFLLQWAADSVIGHWDNYEDWGRGNYRVYHDPATGKWTIIETGIDQTFVEDNDPWKVKAVLATRCLEEPDCEAALNERLQTATDIFESMALDLEAQRIYELIAGDVAADPRKPYDQATFEAASVALRAWIQERAAFMRQRLEQRASGR
jgi:spore coat protein CotH